MRAGEAQWWHNLHLSEYVYALAIWLPRILRRCYVMRGDGTEKEFDDIHTAVAGL